MKKSEPDAASGKPSTFSRSGQPPGFNARIILSSTTSRATR
jgi:hypothetical protein